MVRRRKAPEPLKTLEALRAEKYSSIEKDLLQELLEIQETYLVERAIAVEKIGLTIQGNLSGGDD